MDFFRNSNLRYGIAIFPYKHIADNLSQTTAVLEKSLLSFAVCVTEFCVPSSFIDKNMACLKSNFVDKALYDNYVFLWFHTSSQFTRKKARTSTGKIRNKAKSATTVSSEGYRHSRFYRDRKIKQSATINWHQFCIFISYTRDNVLQFLKSIFFIFILNKSIL